MKTIQAVAQNIEDVLLNGIAIGMIEPDYSIEIIPDDLLINITCTKKEDTDSIPVHYTLQAAKYIKE